MILEIFSVFAIYYLSVMVKIIKKYLIITLLTITFIISFTPRLSAQIPFFPAVENSDTDLPTTPSSPSSLN